MRINLDLKLLNPTKPQILFINCWWILLLSFSFLQNIAAQKTDLQFRHLTLEDGLGDGWVHDVMMDKAGMVWFATHDGLSRYDGHHFKNYKANNHIPKALKGSVLMSIKEGQQDIYWIACNGIGLVRFDAKTESFSAFSHDQENENSISNDAATNIFIDDDGLIWVGTFSGGLNVFDEKRETFRRFDMVDNVVASESFMTNSIRHIIPDPLDKGKLWLATHQGIFHFDKKTGEKKYYPLNKNGEAAFAVSLGANEFGKIWVGAENHGLIEFDSRTEQMRSLSERIQVKAVLQKSKDELWVGTQGKGLGIYNLKTEQWEFITDRDSKSHSILSNDIYGLYQDRDGRLWVRDMVLGVSVSNSSDNLFQQPQMPEQLNRQLNYIKKFSFSPSTNELFVGSALNSKVFVF